MSDWVVVPCLLSLRDEFNRINPDRDKGAEGTIGDTAHTSSSDHTPDEDSNVLRDHDADSKNEVHAYDCDSTGPWKDRGSFKSIFLDVIAGEKQKWQDPDDYCRLEFAIFDKKIYSRSRDFEPVDYTGSDPHTNHAHFSARYLTNTENDTRPWGAYEEDEMTPAQMTELKNFIRSEVAAAVTKLDTQINQVDTEVWAVNAGSDIVETRTTGAILRDLGNGLRPRLWFAPTHPEAAAAVPQAGSPLDTLEKLPAWQAKVLTLLGEVVTASKSK